MDEKEIERLAERFLKGTATDEERRILNKWYDSKNDEQVIVPAFYEGEKQITEGKIWKRLSSMLEEDVTKHTTKPSWQRNGAAHYISIAALILVVLSLSFVFGSGHRSKLVHIFARIAAIASLPTTLPFTLVARDPALEISFPSFVEILMEYDG